MRGRSRSTRSATATAGPPPRRGRAATSAPRKAAKARAPSPRAAWQSGLRLIVGSCQQSLQIAERVKEIGFHGADRAAENSCDLLVGQLMINAKDDRGTLFSRELRDGVTHLRRA